MAIPPPPPTLERDKEAMSHLDKAVLWFGVEGTKEILEDYNEDFEGVRDESSE